VRRSLDLSTPDLTSLAAALAELDREVISGREKGVPSGATKFLDEVGGQGWNLLAGDLPFPLLVIKERELEENIDLMQAFCDTHGALLLPHAKTTMSPQIWQKQLLSGAVGLTVTTVSQLQVAHSFGVPRLFVANELVSDYEVDVVAQALKASFDVFVLVDSLEGVEFLVRNLRRTRVPVPLPVLIEAGPPGGRAGARNAELVLEVARAILHAEAFLQLVGVEGYEGAAVVSHDDVGLAAVDAYLIGLRETSERVRQLLPQEAPFVISAGGSIYFDRVVQHLGRDAFPQAQLLLRPGAYVTHDSEFYERISPLARSCNRLAERSRVLGSRVLQPALELWAAVLSRPEPDLAIIGAGRRDAPYDQGYPIPLLHARLGDRPRQLEDGCEVIAMHDQHMYLRVPKDAETRPGDLIGLGISHPCSAFDRWRLLFLVDEERNVRGAVRTFF
jgi:D-serine dehydratase